MHILFYFILWISFPLVLLVLLLTAFVDVTSVISLYRITLQTSILNGISESGTPATYADMLLIITRKLGSSGPYAMLFCLDDLDKKSIGML